jgi:hypothetical protein
LKDQLPQVQERFQALAAKQILASPAVTGVSSLKDMLSVSLSQQADQEQFAQLYTQYRGDAPQVKTGETPLQNGAGEQVHAFLNEHQGQFEIGMQPVEQYIARNNLQIAQEVTQEVKRIQRVYQITPSDRVMNTLLSQGLDSATPHWKICGAI